MKIGTPLARNGVTCLAVTGEIDMATCDELYDSIITAAAEQQVTAVVVDLAGVTFCDSSGVGAILRAYGEAAQHQVGVTVVNPQRIVRRVLHVTGVLSILGVPE